MARVFRGKIAIPGDQMEAYVEALGPFDLKGSALHRMLLLENRIRALLIFNELRSCYCQRA